jgi:hypothetical protein
MLVGPGYRDTWSAYARELERNNPGKFLMDRRITTAHRENVENAIGLASAERFKHLRSAALALWFIRFGRQRGMQTGGGPFGAVGQASRSRECRNPERKGSQGAPAQSRAPQHHSRPGPLRAGTQGLPTDLQPSSPVQNNSRRSCRSGSSCGRALILMNFAAALRRDLVGIVS